MTMVFDSQRRYNRLDLHKRGITAQHSMKPTQSAVWAIIGGGHCVRQLGTAKESLQYLPYLGAHLSNDGHGGSTDIAGSHTANFKIPFTHDDFVLCVFDRSEPFVLVFRFVGDSYFLEGCTVVDTQSRRTEGNDIRECLVTQDDKLCDSRTGTATKWPDVELTFQT